MKVSSPEVLIEELLYNARASGQKPLEHQMANFTIWFYKNRDRIPVNNLTARQAFIEKSMWIMTELMALLIERQHDLEALKRGRSRLWLPNGIKMNDVLFK